MSFLHDPLSDIQLIASNLRDRYKGGFPILKEIVQNTDDAKAESLVIGWHPGIKSTAHPLLRDPAVFFVNDAPLTEADVKGIRTLGLGSKADDNNAVGKFGLGMKSLFHLGELYFFIGSDWQDYKGEYPKADVLNPWGKERPHWNEFSHNDKAAIQQELSAICSSLDDSAYKFIVWIPLRSPSIARERGESGNNFIYNSDDYGREVPSFLLDTELATQLGQLMPMLKHLRKITGGGFLSGDNAFTELFSTEIDASAERLHFPNLKNETQWQGSINISGGKDKQKSKLSYVGTEVYLQSPLLQNLKNNDFWPISYARNAAGEEQKVLDKAQPHSATVILAQPSNENAKLTVRWAVFLPLGEQDTTEEKQVFETHIQGNMSFDILLHGYFFIDAGRVGIHGRKYLGTSTPVNIDSEDTAIQEWNRLLANQGTLPRLLTSLSQATSKLKLTQLQIDELTDGLRRFLNSNLGHNCLSHVTSFYQWIYQVSRDSQGWELMSSSLPVRKLPFPNGGEFERIWNTFPSLFSLSDKLVFIDGSKPNINASKDATWQESELVTLLKSVPSAVFESSKLLGYLNEFLRETDMQIGTDECQSVLVKLAQAVLRNVELFKLSKNQSAFRVFIDFIRPTYRWSVKVDKDEQALWGVFYSVETTKLFLPAFLDSGHSTKTLDFNDADKLFIQLGKQNLTDQQLSKATDAIIESIEEIQKNNLIKKHDNLKLFSAYLPGSLRAYRESSRHLNALFQGRRLFSRASLNSGSFLLGEPLSAALGDKSVVFIGDKVNQQLFSKKVKTCDTQAVLNLLEKRPQLNKPQERTRLISELEINHLGMEQRLSVRYLMHGSELDKDASQSLWSVGGTDAVWSRLHQEHLSDDESWTIIPYEISTSLKLSNQEKNLLSLQEVNAINVIDNLDADIQFIDFSKVVSSQRDAEDILRYIEDKGIWCNLPLHQTLTGERCSIKDNCFLASGIDLPIELHEAITCLSSAISREVQRQQDENIPKLDATKAIELALAQDTPSKYQSFIIEMLGKLNFFEPILNQLRSTRWLVADDLAVSPNMIVLDDNGTWNVTHQLSKNSSDICFAKNLDIFNDSSFDVIKKILVSNDFDIACLALESAGKLPDYFVGPGNVTRQVLKQASQYKALFKKYELKGWELLIECCLNSEGENLNDEWLNKLSHDILSSDSLIQLHENLVTEADNAKIISELRYALLTIICNQNSSLQQISKLTLRTLSDEFIASKLLCYGVVGVAKSATLHEEDYRAIKHVLPSGTDLTAMDDAFFETSQQQDLDNESTTSSANEVQKYFSDWEPFITNKTAIATVLALMSGTPGIRKVCEYYLGQRTYSNFINEIGKNWVYDKSINLARVETLKDCVSSVEFDIQPCNDKTMPVMSILNKEIEVELEADNTSIFVWDTTRLFYSEPIVIQVRKLPVIEMGESQLLTALKNSAELLLAKVYRQNLTLDHIWDDFSGAEQLDIRAAKLTVMDGIVYQLKELDLNDLKLSKLLKEYDHLVTSAAENHRNVGGEEKGEILEKICRQVETESVKGQVLAAVKHKIEQAQYHPHSVPFELFQNADDAVVELEKLGVDNSEVDRRGVFKINTTEGKIAFLNWGREVNQYRSSSSTIDGTEFGFKTDLQKMIVRNQSDKDDMTTGKFGLGFKSCLLVAETPNIVSGRLAVQIEGGLLPSVSPDYETLFQLAKSEMLEGGLRPTIISLPLREGIEPNDILSRFKKLAGLLTIFSKRINTINIDSQLFQWRPKRSTLINSVTFGVVRVPTKKRNADLKVVVVNTESGRFVFGLNGKGFKPVNQDLPKLWNLSPLQGEFNIGFAVNASFDVDIGRNQLAILSMKNSELFESLGQEINGFLSELYKQCKSNWVAVKTEFNLDDDVDMPTFWASIWKSLLTGLVKPTEAESAESYKNYTNRLFTSEGGILSFYRLYQAFPVGMKGCAPKLVRLDLVSYRAGELLDNMSKHVAKLPVMSELFKAQNIVGFEVGKSLLPLDVKVSTLDLGELIERTLEDNYLSPSSANNLRHVFNSDFDRELKNNKATQEQVDQFRTKLSELRVLVDNGSHRSIKESLIRKVSTVSDEVKVIGFAPDEYITSPKYADSVELIEFCRRDSTPYNLSKIYDWVCRTEVESNIKKQQSICWYLVDGDLGVALASEIKKVLKPLWIFNIDVHHLKGWGWNKKQIYLFRNVRMVTETEADNRVDSQLKNEGRSQLSTQKSLMRIYEWWEEKGPMLLVDYEKELYPGGFFDWQAIRKDKQPECYQIAWLKLFFLGSCQTIGRSKEVHHRAALNHFEQKGWWSVFSDANNPSAWFDVMDQYLLDAVTSDKYRTWLQILPLYRFSNHLDEYIDLFWSADNGLPNIDALVRPSSSAELSGAGSNFAPPELKATLGIGANFILRELYRHDIYTDETLEQYCFVASKGVRDLLGQRLPEGLSLSDPSAKSSQEIYQYLCKHMGEECATFGGNFDIPLRILSRSENTHILENILDIGVWMDCERI